MTAREVTPQILVADQPTEADLDELMAAGLRGVVNLRHAGEPEQPLDPEGEGEAARARGLKYLHRGVGGAPISSELVADVTRFIAEQTQDEGRVLVHCRKGGRAAALVLLAMARMRHWNAADVIEQGRSLGLVVEGGLKQVVEEYLARSESERSA
jgi:uncharacterized protein (TIGR01244 family)